MTDGMNGVAINVLDTPLVMIGALKLWRYSTEGQTTGCVYSWLTNNKWETNFKTECAGCHESRYVVEVLSGIGRPEDCTTALDRNEIKPLVLRN